MSNLLSLEELVAKKKNEGQLQAPKFLSKKERQQLALQRKQSKFEQEQRKPTSQTNSKRSYESNGVYDTDIKKQKALQDEQIAKNYEKVLNTHRGGKKFNFDWNIEEDTLNSADSILSDFSYNEVDNGLITRKQEDADLNDQHWTVKPLDQMRSRDWRILKEDFEIITKGSNVPNPLRSWKESPIDKQLLNIIDKLGYIEPTPIQRASIPISLAKRDIIGIAETGSGKTLAYLIPMLSKILRLPRLNEISKIDGPYGLILVPTRELAQQIESELNKFLKFLPQIITISLVGGKLIEKDILELNNKAIEIVIATPGRLIDCLENHHLVLNQIQFLVLDECDKMIEMNFGNQVAQIDEFITNSKRQNMLFTATMTNEVESLSKNYVSNPAVINIGSVTSREMIINDRIEQKFQFINSDEDSKRLKLLEKILNSNKYIPPIIIFINYKESGEFLFKNLSKSGHKVALIHGSKSQDQRELAIKSLKDGKVDILIGTNVASRGIDINNVSLVINFHMTKKIDDYIHRVGRTGRAGNYGTSITFINEASDLEVIPDLKKLLLKSGNKIPNELRNINSDLRSII